MKIVICAFLVLAIAIFAAVPAAPPVTFNEVSAAAGLKFVHNSGRAGKKWLPETMGSGCAFFDADGDGWPDILLINGKDWAPGGRRSVAGLYRNNHNGTFSDITRGSGLDIEIYGLGVAVADYDNDGREDVYITALDGDHLFHNEGSGKFRDVTRESGIRNAAFSSSALWFDYDPRREGRSVRRELRSIGREGRSVVLPRRGTKSLCTPSLTAGIPRVLSISERKFDDFRKAA